MGDSQLLAPALAPLRIALDLDHTLVCSHLDPHRACDFKLLDLPGTDQVVRVQKRPGVDAFISWLAQQPVEVSVFTAASESYAARITAELDPEGRVIKKVRSREACSPSSVVKGCFMKDVVGQQLVVSAHVALLA